MRVRRAEAALVAVVILLRLRVTLLRWFGVSSHGVTDVSSSSRVYSIALTVRVATASATEVAVAARQASITSSLCLVTRYAGLEGKKGEHVDVSKGGVRRAGAHRVSQLTLCSLFLFLVGAVALAAGTAEVDCPVDLGAWSFRGAIELTVGAGPETRRTGEGGRRCRFVARLRGSCACEYDGETC